MVKRIEGDNISLAQHQAFIQDKIQERALQFAEKGILKKACAYALLNGGKRFRPAIVLMVSEALQNQSDVFAPAFAVECFHTASLVVDDLPCMDNDEERRDKPTVHKLYGEPIALLTSYALIAEGYGAIAEGGKRFVDANPTKAAEGAQIVVMALENAAWNTGLSGATGGQFLDIAPPDLSESTLRKVIHQKTTSLFEIAFVFGWLFGGGDPVKLPTVKQCASHFGMAFQVADDLGDVEQDAKKGRLVNLAGVFGVERAKQILKDEITKYQVLLRKLGIDSPALSSLTDPLEGAFRNQ